MQANQRRGRYDAAWTEIMRGEIPHAHHHHGGHRDHDGPATERVAGRDVGGRAEAEHSRVEAERKEQHRLAERRQPYTTTSREVSVSKSRKLPSNGPKAAIMLN